MSAQAVIDQPVLLTAHPLQRVGAYALRELAGVDTLARLDTWQLEAARRRMVEDLLATAEVEDTKDPRAFWLSASYLLWPNSALNPTNRRNQTPQQRRELTQAWRSPPITGNRPGVPCVPCVLCGREAVGFYGKVDVPLGASTTFRNTTPPGHEGLALCLGCLSSFHALPYGCAIGGGRAAAVHSWDDDFLARTTRVQVVRTLAAAQAGPPGKGARYGRELVALRRLREYDRPLRAGVELIVFSNSNKEQALDTYAMEQPLAEWLRKTSRSPRYRSAFGYLMRAHHTKGSSGTAVLARNAFHNPAAVLTRAANYLADLVGQTREVPGEAGPLAELCFSYSIEVLDVVNDEVTKIRQLAERIAFVLPEEPGQLNTLVSAQRDSDPRRLQSWLHKQAVNWLLGRGKAGGDTDRPEGPFVTTAQWELLFRPGAPRFHRELLLVAVLEELHRRGWLTDDPKLRNELEEVLMDEEEEK